MKSIVFAACCMLFVSALWAASLIWFPQTALRPSVDLTARDYELSERVIWDQKALITDCRENFARGGCQGPVHQFIQGPFSRDDTIYVAETDFLTHRLKNRLASSTYESKYFSVHERCNESALAALNDWRRTITSTEAEEVIFVSYLSPQDPWFFCFHRDRWAASSRVAETSKFELEFREFWLWHEGFVVGEVQCGTLYRRNSDSPRFPQCNINLSFANGDVQMHIGPFPAASIRSALHGIDSMTHKFWQRIRGDLQSYGVQKDLFYRQVAFSDRAARELLANEEATR